ncbi:putative E3 ubiquitin-protein ligase DTX3 [Babylonia areolata]|uniref:putative E3 ubiquitin-protein ligase DTX3 n=1 Tax=Babylonia areolata TaxID=304850 RepID=UPI003FD1D0F1
MSANSKFSAEFVPNYGMKVHHRGDIDITESNSRMVLLPVVGLYHRDSQQEIHAAAQKVLIKVSQARRRTVAFPGYPYGKHHNSDQALEAFAVALYQAVKNVSTMPDVAIHVTEIYIVHPEEKSIQTLKECFERAVDNTDKAKPDRRQNSRHSTTPVCSVCWNEKQCKTLDTCGHHLCDDCSKELREPKCPDCGTAWGEIHGDQPKGTMKVKYDKTQQLPGFPPGTFVILYKFPGGKHSEQAKQYAEEKYLGKEETAYLPDVPEGRKVLMLLKIAFDRGLLFRLGEIQRSSWVHSQRTPEYGITWSGIEHKTAKKQAARYSFPDDGYLNRVQQQLAVVGVFASDLTEQQKTFIRVSSEHVKSALSSLF